MPHVAAMTARISVTRRHAGCSCGHPEGHRIDGHRQRGRGEVPNAWLTTDSWQVAPAAAQRSQPSWKAD